MRGHRESVVEAFDGPLASSGEEPSFCPRESRPEFLEIWRRPLPHMAHVPATRLAIRLLLTLFRSRIAGIRGIEHLGTRGDPIILALNHNQRLEAILLPVLLFFHRGGKLIHFMADWNFLMIPVVGAIIRMNEPIVVGRKDAKPRWLNRFKPRFVDSVAPFERAAMLLREGKSVGVFPEGTVNRHPTRMLKGYHGAARVSLETGVPVVPAGIRFPSHDPTRPISDLSRWEVEIGEPLRPAPREPGQPVTGGEVLAWHHQIMSEIARLSGKEWQPTSPRKKYVA